MTRTEFSAVFTQLAIALRCTDADAVTIRVYYHALADLELELVRWAAERLSRQVGADGAAWFPKTAEWRATAGQIERERTDELLASLRRRPTPLCEACRDTTFARDEVTNTVKPCNCGPRRRALVLGRLPMPALPAAPIDPTPVTGDNVQAIYAATLARLQVTASPIKTMSHTKRARLVTDDQRAKMRRLIHLLKEAPEATPPPAAEEPPSGLRGDPVDRRGTDVGPRA